MDLLNKINECIPLIQEDFNLIRISSISFKSPIYYPDLTMKLSREYELKFGRKNATYLKLNTFLLTSSLNSQLENFLDPLSKKVVSYSIEKFQVIEKEAFINYLPEADIKNYPGFALGGMAVSVKLKSKP